MKFIYSPAYLVNLGPHVFPIAKYRMIYERLRQQYHVPEAEFENPQPATREQLLRVHTPEYLADLEQLKFTERTAYSELPLTHEVVAMFRLAAGGTIRAAALALEEGAAVHIGGGFHHAFADKAEGFCYINDLALGVRECQALGKIKRAMVIDCDLHQGNGTARIFAGDEAVFTFSIHQDDLYPVKQQSDLDIALPNHVQDEEYLGLLRTHIPRALDEFRPELILYQAGADPYRDDQLGDLSLTVAGLRRRDEIVFTLAKARNIPLAVTLGGGYAYNTDDTVAIHVNTCATAMQMWGSP